MITVYIMSVLAFAFMFLFEQIKVKCHREKREISNPFFSIGTLLLLVSWICAIIIRWNRGAFLGMAYLPRVITGAVLVLLSIVFYAYILFFALPKDTYKVKGQGNTTVDSGIYKKCRHPGFYGFTLFAFSMAILGGSRTSVVCAVVYSICNLIYIILQDIYYFPAYLEGYDQYKKEVPFLAFWK